MVNKSLHMYRRGITLIEVIVVLQIMFLIISFSSASFIKLYNNWNNRVSVDYSNNYILDMIKNSAVYCKKENKSGYLLFIGGGKVDFYCSNKKVEQYDISDGFKFVNTEIFNKMIRINNLGEVLTPCTITYKDNKGGNHSITIRVGTRYAKVK